MLKMPRNANKANAPASWIAFKTMRPNNETHNNGPLNSFVTLRNPYADHYFSNTTNILTALSFNLKHRLKHYQYTMITFFSQRYYKTDLIAKYK